MTNDSELFTKLANDEKLAREHIIEKCFSGRKTYCPRCREHKIYSINGNRFRCSSCKYTFQELSGRWINNGGLKCKEWIRIIQLFAKGETAHFISSDLSISYNAAYKALTAIRFAILSQAIDATQLLSVETGLHKHIKNKKLTGINSNKRTAPIPVFGILEKNGWVFIDLLQNINGESVFHFNHNFHLKLVKHGAIIHTDKYQKYDALILCGDESLPMEYIRKYPDIVPNIEKSNGEFWDFARIFFKNYKGISPHRFPLYLKEIEFRFNNRNNNLEDLLLGCVCNIVPEID